MKIVVIQMIIIDCCCLNSIMRIFSWFINKLFTYLFITIYILYFYYLRVTNKQTNQKKNRKLFIWLIEFHFFVCCFRNNLNWMISMGNNLLSMVYFFSPANIFSILKFFYDYLIWWWSWFSDPEYWRLN